MDWDPHTRQLIVKRRGVIYWTSGALLGDKDFEFIKTDGNSNFNYNFSYVTTNNEEYFAYSSLMNDQNVVSGRSWLLNYLGNVYDGGDRDKHVIAQVDQCYGFNSNGGGCQVWEKPKCKTRYQRFENKSGGFHDADRPQPTWLDYNESLGLSDCRAMCWNNCNCTGFKGDYALGCLFWTSKKEFHQHYAGATDPHTRQLIIKRRGVIYWTSGALLGDKDFEFIKTDGNSNFNYNFSYVTTKNEEYFAYSSLMNDQKVVSGRRWLLNYLGNVYDGGDRDKHVIAQVDQCYGFNSDGGGCQVWEKPKCKTRYQSFGDYEPGK
ncbi:hypothetical protein LOK49_LG03G02308 [Camellia lanceoleosa]|uniref:Uncharacterized protein n=1 Tax=Camellia lanceoleosa TaxID=1840588 RepID=A0ACC0I816_9ERIC|nr:hypothetical protein LOK49_LG03G02308 [Camellia lanceoleosa]